MPTEQANHRSIVVFRAGKFVWLMMRTAHAESPAGHCRNASVASDVQAISLSLCLCLCLCLCLSLNPYLRSTTKRSSISHTAIHGILSIYLSIYLYLYLSIYIYISIPILGPTRSEVQFHRLLFTDFCLSVCLSVCLSLSLSLSLSIYLYLYLYLHPYLRPNAKRSSISQTAVHSILSVCVSLSLSLSLSIPILRPTRSEAQFHRLPWTAFLGQRGTLLDTTRLREGPTGPTSDRPIA